MDRKVPLAMFSQKSRTKDVPKAASVTLEASSTADAVAEISAAIGRPVRFTQSSPEQFAAAMQPYVPRDVIDLLLELFTVVLDGRNVQVMNGVQEALGRPARDFSEYVRTTAATGVWNR
jgi:hypothetical protein